MYGDSKYSVLLLRTISGMQVVGAGSFFPSPGRFRSIKRARPYECKCGLPPSGCDRGASFMVLSACQIRPTPLSIPKVPPYLCYLLTLRAECNTLSSSYYGPSWSAGLWKATRGRASTVTSGC